MRMILVAAAAATILLAPTLPAQGHKCSKCKDTGLLKCKSKLHNQKKICGVTWPHDCTAIFRAKCCRGTHQLLCKGKYCNDPVVEIEHNEALETRKAWVDRMRAFDKKASVRFEHVEVDDWVLHYSIPRFKPKESSYNKVKGAHYFMALLKRTSEKFKEVTGLLPAQKQTVFLMADGSQTMTVTLHFAGTGHATAFKLYSTASKAFTWPRPPELKKPEDFESHVCHLGAHQLVQASVRFQTDIAAWLDIGLAHWIELEVTEKKGTFCFNELNAAGKNRWQTGKWKKMIAAEIRKNAAETFANISRRDTDNLGHRDHAHCWSYVDFLINAHPEKFKKLFTDIKRTNDTKQALDTHFQWSTSAFDSAWRKHVIKKYDIR